MPVERGKCLAVSGEARDKLGPGHSSAMPHGEWILRRPALHEAQTRKAAIFSLGVSHPRHFRGRSFQYVSIRWRSSPPISAKEDFLGWSLRISPLVFSFVPRSQE